MREAVHSAPSMGTDVPRTPCVALFMFNILNVVFTQYIYPNDTVSACANPEMNPVIMVVVMENGCTSG